VGGRRRARGGDSAADRSRRRPNARSHAAPRGRGPRSARPTIPARPWRRRSPPSARQASPDLGQLRALETGADAGAGRGGRAGAGGRGGGGGGGRAGGGGRGNTTAADADDDDDAAANVVFRASGTGDGGELTALIYAARANDRESVQVLLDAGVDVNQRSGYGWSPLLVAAEPLLQARGVSASSAART
jgi:hypothetical protein